MAELGELRLRLGVGAIVLLAVVKFGAVPVVEWQDGVVEELTGLRRVVAVGGGLPQRLKGLEASAREIEKRRQELGTQLPRFNNFQELQASLKGNLEQWIGELQLSLESTSWGHRGDGDVVEAVMNLKLRGGFPEVVELVRRVEGYQHKYVLNRVNFKAKGRGSGLVDADLEVVAYGVVAEPLKSGAVGGAAAVSGIGSDFASEVPMPESIRKALAGGGQ